MANEDKNLPGGETPELTEEQAPAKDKDAEDNKDEELGGKMTFIEHLEELRRRIIVSALTIAGCFIVIYSTSSSTIAQFITEPLVKTLSTLNSHMIFTGFAEGFFFDLKVSAAAAIFIASPMIFYQIWAFVAPGLYKNERRYVGPFIFFSTFFFVSGGAFFYFVVFPIVVSFFSQFAISGEIAWMPKLSETFSFIMMMTIAFGLAFQLPIIAFILARLGIINVGLLNRNRKYAILVMLILAAILTPPDVVSQMLLAGPMWLLYELSVIVTWIFGPKKRDEEEEEEETEEEKET